MMTSFVSGIRPVAPLAYRCWNGVAADLWHVEAGTDGRGNYTARDPRFVIILGPEDSPLRLCCDGQLRPVPIRVAYVPARVPAQSSISRHGRFRHLDLHFERNLLAQRMAISGSGAECLLDTPVLLEKAEAAQAIAELLADEIRQGTNNALVLDSLAFALAAKVFATSAETAPAAPIRGGLTAGQLAQVDRLMQSEMHRRLSISEMAERAGLSESWFARAYRQSRAETPHRALQKIRVNTAKRLLEQDSQSIADVAAMVGFADQAHLTRAFRTITGQTPGAWRRSVISGQDCTIPEGFSQDSHR